MTQDEIDKKLASLTNAEWIALARSTFKPPKPKPCAVCDRYASLAQAHHLVPLSMQAERRPEYVCHDHLWLCPTHHAAVHVLISHKSHQNSQVLNSKRMTVILELADDDKELAVVNSIAMEAFR